MKRAFLFGLLCWMTLACPWLQAQTLFGVKGGVTLPRLYYTNPSLGKLTHIDTSGTRPPASLWSFPSTTTLPWHLN